jgi:hypothetical protein
MHTGSIHNDRGISRDIDMAISIRQEEGSAVHY